MDRNQVEALHQKAAEQYLEGNYSAACACWKRILETSPSDDRALEGLRLCELLEADAPPEAVDLDVLTEMDEDAPAQALPEAPGDYDADGLEVALENFSAAQESDPLAGIAAETELQSRVQALMKDAREAAEAGRDDDALAILSRLFILDEEHAEARELEEALRDRRDRGIAAMEDRIAEGVQWLEAGRIDEARQRFEELFEEAPEHAEIRHYLQVAEQRAAAVDEEPEVSTIALTARPAAVEPEANFEPLAASPPVTRATREPRTQASDVVEPEVALAPARPNRSRSALFAAAGLAVLVAAAWFGRSFLPGSKPSDPEVAEREAREQLDRAGTETAALMAQADRLTEAAVVSDASTSPAVASDAAGAVAEGVAAFDRGDFGAAVIAFDRAVKLDPANADAARRLADAGQRYRATEAIRSELERARRVFDEGDYAGSLRIVYRLPEGADAAVVNRLRQDGWYNLGVVSLKAGEPSEAEGHFQEALAVRPDDGEARAGLDLAKRFANAAKDRTYYAEVEPLEFRPTPR